MKKKIFILVLLLLFSTGCSVDYNLTIDKELIIEEQITFKENTNIINTQTLDIDNFLNTIIEDYKDNPLYDKYVYQKYSDESITKVAAKTIYLDLQNYLQNNVIKDVVFDDIQITKEKNIYDIIYKVKKYNDIDLFKDSQISGSAVDEIKINITLPFKVITNNSDEFDIDSNTYSWTYKKNQTLDDIMIKFDISKPSIKKESVGVYLLLGMAAVLFLIVGYAFYKYRKNDKI